MSLIKTDTRSFKKIQKSTPNINLGVWGFWTLPLHELHELRENSQKPQKVRIKWPTHLPYPDVGLCCLYEYSHAHNPQSAPHLNGQPPPPPLPVSRVFWALCRQMFWSIFYSFNYSMFFLLWNPVDTYVLMMNPDLLCSTIFSPHNFDADPKDISLWTRRSKWGLTWHSGPVWIQMLPPHHPRQSDRDLKTQVGKKLWNKCVADRHNYGCRTLIYSGTFWQIWSLISCLMTRWQKSASQTVATLPPRFLLHQQHLLWMKK